MGRKAGSAPKRARSSSNSEVRAMEVSVNASALEAMIIKTIIFPEKMLDAGMQYADGINEEASNPQGTFVTFNPDWPQTGPLTYPTGHRLAGQIVTDATGQPLQLVNILTDEVTNNWIGESKNSTFSDLPYQEISESGSSSYIIPAAVLGEGTPPPYELKPSSLVFNPAIIETITDFSKNRCIGAAQGAAGNILPRTGFLNNIQGHDLILPVGTFDNHRAAWVDHTTQAANPLVEPINCMLLPAAQNPVLTAPILAALSSACKIFTVGAISTAAGYQQWFTGDKITISGYQFNENMGGDPTWTMTAVFPPNPLGAGLPFPEDFVIAMFPIATSDNYYWTVQAISANGNGDTVDQVKKTIKVSQISGGGYFGHHMAPAINKISQLANWDSTRLLATSISAENWDKLEDRGGKAVWLQAPLGSFWQARGIDPPPSGGVPNPYTFNASQKGEEKDTYAFGYRAWLAQTGRDCYVWRDNLDVPSTLVPTQFTGGPPSGDTFKAEYRLKGRNFGMHILLSPGLGTSVTAVVASQVSTTVNASPQAAQQAEITIATVWEGKTEEQTLARRYPIGNPDIWDAACKRAAHMKRAGRVPTDDTYMDRYYKSEGWRMRAQG